jgi:small redox-active disulfide protein 2
MKIEVLGTGCAKCAELERRAKEAVAKAGVKAEVTHVYDLEKILERGVVSTPALMVDGVAVASGRVPGVDELVRLLKGRG